MVLCATSAEGKVEFVVPPEGAKPGERVSFAGHTGVPAADPKVMDKKKVRARPRGARGVGAGSEGRGG